MARHNTDQLWGSVSKALHWSIAVLIIGNIIVAQWISTLDPSVPGEPELWRFLVPLHKSIGLAALLLIVIRLGWAITGTRPGLAPGLPQWQHNLTHTVHMLLYIMMLIMPLMGFAASASTGAVFEFFGLFVVPNVIEENKTVATVTYWVHFVTGWMMAGLVAVHAAAALYHHFYKGDDILSRMLPTFKNNREMH